MCPPSQTLSIGDEQVVCEQVASHIIKKDLSVTGLAALGVNLTALSELRNRTTLSSNAAFAAQVVTQVCDLKITPTGGLKSFVDECQITLGKSSTAIPVSTPKASVPVLVGVRG